MVVDLVNVFLHLACQRGSHLATTGFASQMRRVGIELTFEIDQDWATRCEFLIGDRLLELGISLVHFGVERSRIEVFAGHGKLVDECEFKISQTLDLRIAAAFTESRRAATRDKDRGNEEEHVSNNGI